MTTMRFGMAGFYLLLAALGAFWLYFFNRKSVKDQFLGAPAATRALALDLAPASASARPLSITVIAWFLVIGALLAALGYPLSRAMFRERELPFCFLGIFVSGTTGMMIFYSWMLAQATAAVGLFRLKRWGWLSAIALQILGIANTLLIFAVPANFARFNEVLKGLHTVLPSSANQSVAFLFPAWLGMAGSLPLVVAVLWILISQRKAFSPHTPARQ